jgi:hypothetical protein
MVSRHPMRKAAAIFHRIFAGLACLLLTACFDIREELWVHRDGSGKAELTYVVPASTVMLTGGTEGLERKIRELIATQPMLKLEALSVTEGERGVTVAATVTTESMLSLVDLKKSDDMRTLPGAATDIAGDFDVRLQGLDIDFSRTIKVRDALGLAAIGVGAEDRKNRKLTYVLHLPKRAESSNAMIVEDDGKTLKWEATLGEAMSKPLVTSFRARMPVPVAVWYGLGLVVVALTVLMRKVWKWRKRRAERVDVAD